MNYAADNKTVIILVDETAKNGEFVKRWLEKNEFLTCEATDVFQALEEISDFTVRQCPSVILLETNALSEDYVREVFQTSCGVNNVSVIALSKTTSSDFTESLAQLKQKLTRAMPKMSHAA